MARLVLTFYFMSRERLARTKAITAYTLSRIADKSRAESAIYAHIAANDVLRHLRAPYWDEKIYTNTGRRRSYVSPLGQILGAYDYIYGHHCAAYPRTLRSYNAAQVVRAGVLDYLEAQYLTVLDRLSQVYTQGTTNNWLDHKDIHNLIEAHDL